VWTPRERRRFTRESYGSPFFVDELVRHVDEAKHAETPKEITLDEILLTRISRVPTPSRRFLEVAASRMLEIVNICSWLTTTTFYVCCLESNAWYPAAVVVPTNETKKVNKF